MKKIWRYVFTLNLAGLTSLALAANPVMPSAPMTHQSGFFIGVGGSYNSVYTANDPISMSLNATTGIPPLGIFSGTTSSYNNTKGSFAPEGQIGYFRHLTGSNWLLGGKFWYQDLQSQITNTNISANLTGSDSIDIVTPGSVQTNVRQELALQAFIGRSFLTGFVYFGAGPTFFNIKNTLSNLSDAGSGYYIGNLGSFSQSKWQCGAAIQAGITYYLNPTWFLDVNYNYAITAQHTTHFSGSFSPILNESLNGGTISLNMPQQISVQSIIVSINKSF